MGTEFNIAVKIWYKPFAEKPLKLHEIEGWRMSLEMKEIEN